MAESGATPITNARSTRSGVVDGPIQGLHAADGAAQNQPQPPNSHRIQKPSLRPDVVAD